jgi:hypothetical protein
VFPEQPVDRQLVMNGGDDAEHGVPVGE